MPSAAELLLERVRSATQDEYAIERELGRGGMAAVYLARDKALERRVAIKVMLPDLIGVAGIEDRFVIEARTAAHLDHPGIVTVYSVKQRDGLLFIVMKYVEGRTLEEVLAGSRTLETGVITTVASQVAEALHFAHGENVVHRDVKPSNIIIDTKGRPIVTDFGIAKIATGRSITVTGSMIGTPAYMSPEQCRGLPATAASDQYALGVMLYEMLARRMPFEGTMFELIHAHCNEAPPPLHDLIPDIDRELESTVMRMLAKNPRERWESLGEVARQLTQSKAHGRRSSEVRAVIADLARPTIEAMQTPRRPAAAIDISGAATEVATTPAPQLVVTPIDPVVEVGEDLQLRVSESSGASLSGVRITWKSEDPSIATVDDRGIVTGRAVGLAKITATGGAAFGRVPVQVRPATVNTLAITPRNPEVVTDHELELRVAVLDARGNPMVGQPIVWTSSDVRVCAVSQQGRAIGIAEGSATITAACGDVSATVQVRVRLPGVERIVLDPADLSLEVDERARVSAVVFAPHDRKLTGRTVTWRSTVPEIATVDADGNVKGVSPGTGAIVAVCEGKQGIVSISVRSQPVTAVRIRPAQLQLEIGKTIQLQGVGEDRRGHAVSTAGLDWQSDDDSVALVDASGKVHAVGAGRTHVRAMAGDVTSSIEVTVVPRPAKQIRIDAHETTLSVGEFVSLDATVLDDDGLVLENRPIAWTSSEPSVVAIRADGTCEAKKLGSVRITASCEQARATTKLSVRAVAAAGVAGGATSGTDAQAAATAKMPRVSASQAAAMKAAKAGAETPSQRRRSGVLVGGIVLVLLAGAGVVWSMLKGDSPSTQLAQGQDTVPASKSAVDTPTVSTPAPGATIGGTSQKSTSEPASSPASRGGAGSPGATPPVSKSPTGARANTPTNTGANTGSKAAADPDANTQRAQTPPRTTDPQRSTPPAARVDTPVVARRDSTPPQTVTTPPPRRDSVVVTTPPPSTPPAGRAAEPAAPPAVCTNAALPTAMLTEALGSSPVTRLGTLYQPKDAADTRAKNDMLSALRGMNTPRFTARAVTAQGATAGGCDWTAAVEANGTNAFGQPRTARYEVRLHLDTSGSPRIESISNAVRK
ncbi:MAG TPA: Ig-like domain-containing protein [Gemmatimonadaceae bacterium]|nr:Ig-like domain-containing protein [Gemmatimonadaceae bacterium]